MMVLKVMSGLMVVICLAGCGGSGGPGVENTPPPTGGPVPASVPSPSRTPISQEVAPPELPAVTTGTLADAIRNNADFRTGSTELIDDVTQGQLSSRNKAYDSPSSIRVYFDATARKYIVSNIIGTAHRFPDGYSFFGGEGMTTYGQNAVDGVRRLSILTPQANNPKIALTYTSYGVWQFDSSDRDNIDPQINDYHFFYFGVPTSPDGMPRTGSATYNGIAQGAMFDRQSTYVLDGTMTLSADFAASALTTRLDLRGTNVSNGLLVIVPVLNGEASIGAGTNAFRGTLTAADNSLTGSVQGAFFGPSAQEVGYSFAFNNAELDKLAGGAAVGKR